MKMTVVKIPLTLFVLSVLAGCAVTGEEGRDKDFLVGDSYLRQAPLDDGQPVEVPAEESFSQERGVTRIPSMDQGEIGFTNDGALADTFSSRATLTLTAEEMSLKDFVHYTFGELLQVNYILGQRVDEVEGSVTLNVQENISPQRLFAMVERQLLEYGVGVKKQDELFYFYVLRDDEQGTAVGYGRTPDTVPNALNVIQITPLRFNFNNNLIRTIRDVTGARTTGDIPQGVLFINGERGQVIRALELLTILDRPGTRSRNIAFVRLQYMGAEQFIESMTEILRNEGLMTGEGSQDNRVSFVQIPQMGAVAVFASESDFIDRVEYWSSELDKPAKGTERQYFIYTPRFARASDLGLSLENLISGTRGAQRQRAQAGSEERSADIENRQVGGAVASNDDLRMVVDERANTLIFHSSGSQYQQLLPLIERLDIMPRQVLLELTIAEVTLTDEFRFGVDTAFSSGRFSGSTSFGGTAIGGAVLNWVGNSSSVNMQAFESNSHVNVLSKPTLLVRDGMDASILVGTDIPVVGRTTTDPVTGTTRSIEYRKTGIEVNVTPTVNAQGVVIMTIDQSNSNEVDGGSDVEGNPQIFERNLSTEVVAESGQTIVLGGLISENTSDSNSGVPGLRRLPFLGPLFGSISKNTVKTELVIMVTPRVVNRNDEWDDIKARLNEGLRFLDVQ